MALAGVTAMLVTTAALVVALAMADLPPKPAVMTDVPPAMPVIMPVVPTLTAPGVAEA
jgi:hypothetical protein